MQRAQEILLKIKNYYFFTFHTVDFDLLNYQYPRWANFSPIGIELLTANQGEDV